MQAQCALIYQEPPLLKIDSSCNAYYAIHIQRMTSKVHITIYGIQILLEKRREGMSTEHVVSTKRFNVQFGYEV